MGWYVLTGRRERVLAFFRRLRHPWSRAGVRHAG
jgi:hypothetical protein